MENNLYYAPEISEFHVGFDYEIKIKDNWRKKSTTISDFSPISDYDGMSILEEDLISNIIRVKTLDQSDIESLGWKYKSKSIDIWFEKEGTFNMGSWTAYKIIIHYGLHDNRLTIYADDPGLEDYHIFRGTIKNKAQLKFIMKCLGILE